MKRAVVLGAGGFIGSHLVERLKSEGYWVRGVDLVFPEYLTSSADEYLILDLRIYSNVISAIDNSYEEVYQLAADMGGAGYVFSGKHDADILYNSALINLNVAKICAESKVGKLFYSSSACMYPEYNQLDPLNPKCAEDSAYPAQPDSEYGWEKLFSERLYLSFQKNYGLVCKIARFHNIYGPKGAWNNGKEKAPAAICRKVISSSNDGFIEIWGDGQQTRSFLYIDDCIDAIRLLMLHQDFHGPINIGSEEIISINELAEKTIAIAKKNIAIKNVAGPQGVRGRCSDNRLIKKELYWEPQVSLDLGLQKTYTWIEKQINNSL